MSLPQTLIHISDLHFVKDQTLLRGFLENKSIFSKQQLGWLNYKLRRHRHFDPFLKVRLFSYLQANDWDYLIITGDLTTLSLESEFIAARNFLEPLIRKGKVLFTTGNHDRYIQTQPDANLLSVYFNDCWPFNLESGITGANRFYEIGDYAVILELAMAVPRLFYSSRGKLEDDLPAITKIVNKRYKDRTKIAIGHYPAFLPPGEQEGFFHSLAGKERLRRFLLDCGFSFYLHGHIHKSWMFNPIKNHRLICVNSAGCCCHAAGNNAGFHKIILTPSGATIEHIQLSE